MGISYVFRCDRCRTEAGKVTLYGRGETIAGHTRDEVDRAMSEVANTHAEQPRLQVLSQVGNVTIFEFNVTAALAALSAGDARALHALDIEFVPFWCPRCNHSYCGRHWITWDLFDDGFFDEKRGRCPAGHERTLLD